jgi:hypothetical protein
MASSNRMLKKSASLPSASVWFVWFIWLILFNETNQRNQMDQTDQITRQTGLVPDVLAIEVLACHNSFSATC